MYKLCKEPGKESIIATIEEMEEGLSKSFVTVQDQEIKLGSNSVIVSNVSPFTIAGYPVPFMSLSFYYFTTTYQVTHDLLPTMTIKYNLYTFVQFVL